MIAVKLGWTLFECSTVSLLWALNQKSNGKYMQQDMKPIPKLNQENSIGSVRPAHFQTDKEKQVMLCRSKMCPVCRRQVEEKALIS